jgi:hypothetical protein
LRNVLLRSEERRFFCKENFPTMFYGGYGMPYPSAPFEQNYRCYSASFIDKPHLENGDKGMR